MYNRRPAYGYGLVTDGGLRWLLWALLVLLSGCAGNSAVKPGATPPDLGARLVILVSDDSPAFTNIADAIQRRVRSPAEVHVLNSDARRTRGALQAIQRSPRSTVVAVGLPAALAARGLTGKDMVFCQVFNYEAHNLISPSMKGVSAVPPVVEQFRTWKSVDPTLRRVGVILGGGLTSLVAEARQAAKLNNLDLAVVTVRSDRELLYAYKRLNSRIDGLWLVPDNRVLSTSVIQELMSSSIRQGKRVLVFTPELIRFGATLSVDTDPDDIAARVLGRLATARGGRIAGPPVLSLGVLHAQINPAVAKAVGLSSERLRREIQ